MRLKCLRVIVVACLLVQAKSSFAGNGGFENGKFDFCVSVRFNATPAQLQQIESAFSNGSQVLADATDGQHRFGRVKIVNNSGASDAAEYWVNQGSGRAYATRGRYGVRGEHVMLYFDSNFQGVSGSDGDAYTVAHEHAHHAYGVLDEYSGPGGAGDCAAGPDGQSLSYCLMDNYFTRGGRSNGGNTYTLNEFCVLANHDPDADTYQDSVNGKSCWETISRHPIRGATAPTSLPQDAPPGPQAVSFGPGAGTLHSMLLLDRSGSMSQNQRLEFAKSGGKVFANLLFLSNLFQKNDQALGISSFADNGSLDFPLTEIMDAVALDVVKASIDSINASGSTNIGGGLLAALGELTSQPSRSCNEIIVLLSDGDHNVGIDPSVALPQLKAESVAVIAIGVGDGISTNGQATLQTIGTTTGGRFFQVANSFDLVALFARLLLEITGSGVLSDTRSPLDIGATREQPVLVEINARSATFVLATKEKGDSVSFILVTPSGIVVTPSDSINGNIRFTMEANSQAYQIGNPEPGTWIMRVVAGSAPVGEIKLTAGAEHDGVQLNVVVENDMPNFPEPMRIRATLRYEGESVTGAAVGGVVRRPDGSEIPIILYDDGASAGDEIAGDGVYSSRFSGYNASGTYTAELTAHAPAGRTIAGEDFFNLAPSNTRPVPEFIRMGSATAVLMQAPLIGITSVSPGSAIPGTEITLKGFGFAAGSVRLFLGGIEIVNFHIVDNETIVFTLPAIPAGVVDVRVETVNGNFVFKMALEVLGGALSIPVLQPAGLILLGFLLLTLGIIMIRRRQRI